MKREILFKDVTELKVKGKNRCSALLLVVLLALFVSCKQEDKFDLLNVSFPVKKELLNSVGVETKDYNTHLDGEIRKFSSEKDSVLIFGNVKLSGNISRYNKDLFFANYVEFFEDPVQKNIGAYQVNIHTTEETKALEEFMAAHFGKTDFYYKDQKISCRVWEADKRIFFFGVMEGQHSPDLSNSPHSTCLLFVIANSNKELMKESPAGSYFKFYKDYLDKKESTKQQAEVYTYSDFVRDSGNETIYTTNYVGDK
ncbi:hypothetical protein ACR777_19260 [Sphingobacterium spiritivorum]|uniref:hypothetical protein n=1 Tax=Sphingobacterium spiritivorum TaxID=258 RepID=UPI003DA54833